MKIKNKKLYRSSSDRMIAGVCGGLAQYLEVDSTIIRLVAALVTFMTGIFPVGLVYIVAIYIVPEKKY